MYQEINTPDIKLIPLALVTYISSNRIYDNLIIWHSKSMTYHLGYNHDNMQSTKTI